MSPEIFVNNLVNILVTLAFAGQTSAMIDSSVTKSQGQTSR